MTNAEQVTLGELLRRFDAFAERTDLTLATLTSDVRLLKDDKLVRDTRAASDSRWLGALSTGLRIGIGAIGGALAAIVTFALGHIR